MISIMIYVAKLANNTTHVTHMIINKLFKITKVGQHSVYTGKSAFYYLTLKPLGQGCYK